MKKIILPMLCALLSSFAFSQSETVIASNSLYNQFQCNNGPWLQPNLYVISFKGDCTPLRGKAKDTGIITTIETTANQCKENEKALYKFFGWENRFDFYGCKAD